MALKKKSIITGALILTLASIVTRLLGFVYRIYMSNSIGAEGMGLYQLIMPVYSLAWSITCSGITTTVSKLIAQENAKREYGNMGRILKQALFLTCGLSLAVTTVLFLFSSQIAVSILGDSRTQLSLKYLAFAVPFMAAGSCIRGYFFGLQEQVVPAVSQVAEQIVRMAVIYIIGAMLVPMGLEYACLAAVFGVILGELISFFYVLAAYRFFKSKNKLTKKPILSPSASLYMIVSMALPLSMNRIANSLLSTAENLLIPQRLQMSGMSAQEAMSLFGRVTGMAMPLIFFPSALLVSLSVALVPAIAEASAVKNKRRISETVSKSLMFTSIIGSFAAMVFTVLPDELGRAIYNQDIGWILFTMGIMCPLWYLGITISGLLNGMGEQLFIFRNSIISSVITISCIYFFVPQYGVAAFIVGWAIALLFVTVVSLFKLRKSAGVDITIARWFVKPALVACAAGLVTEYVSNNFVFPVLGNLPGLAASLMIMSVLYIIFIVLFGCIKISDIKRLYRRSPFAAGENKLKQ